METDDRVVDLTRSSLLKYLKVLYLILSVLSLSLCVQMMQFRVCAVQMVSSRIPQGEQING